MKNKPEKNTVYEVLDACELKNRMSESFPSVYLTIISIVQGVSLGILSSNVYSYFRKYPSIDQIVTIIPYALLSFSTIVVISFEYNWFVGVYRWSPKLRDTLIPYILGVGQLGPLFFIDWPKWWWFLNIFLVLSGAFAFSNTYNNCKRGMFDSNDAYNICFKNARFNFLFTLSSVLIPLLHEFRLIMKAIAF